MKKIYFLKTCDTCTRILKSINLDGFKLQEIKTESISVAQLEEMVGLSGSYESLFSRRAKKYKQMDLKNQELNESDYRQLILDEYTFLKRPVTIIDQEIFIGNSKKSIEALQEKLS
jgi:arsenate reductase